MSQFRFTVKPPAIDMLVNPTVDFGNINYTFELDLNCILNQSETISERQCAVDWS